MRKLLIILISLTLATTLFTGCFGRGGHSLNIDASEIYRISGHWNPRRPSYGDITDRNTINSIVEHLNSFSLTDGEIIIGGETPDVYLLFFDSEDNEKFRIAMWHQVIRADGSYFGDLGGFHRISGLRGWYAVDTLNRRLP